MHHSARALATGQLRDEGCYDGAGRTRVQLHVSGLAQNTEYGGNAARHMAATTTVPWQFDSTAQPKRVIIHVEHTHTGLTDFGIAGAGSACLTVPF